MERNFKGIWIPKEVWLSKDLTIMEKMFLVEIDSLDNEKGCFASNGYFADFFDISKGRCTQIIKSLEAKGYIKISLEYKGKQIVKRTIRVVNKLNTLVNKLNNPSEKTKYPYLENDEDNNTSINNTSINNTINKDKPFKADALDGEFDEWWEIYNKKIDKKKSLQRFKSCRKKHSYEQIKFGTEMYLKTVTDKKYQKHPTTFLNGESYLDVEGYEDLTSKRGITSMVDDLGLEREPVRELTEEEKANIEELDF